MKTKYKIVGAIALLLILGLFYYLVYPAITFHSIGLWILLIVILLLVLAVMLGLKEFQWYEIKRSKPIWIVASLFVVVFLTFAIGGIISLPLVSADSYQKLLKVKDGEFAVDIKEVSYDKIPILDKNSAILLGDRKMGSMIDMASQFEVDDIYTQINYQGKPVRVSPLKYANFIKWMTNQDDGIPAYIMIDMATQETELVKLEKGIKYSTSEYFNRNIYRHLQFHYPTYVFNDLSFEIDEEGVPYWVCPVIDYNIGWFGGQTIDRVVLCNAITGDTKDYDVKDVPKWVDRVYSADMLMGLYDYYGTLKHGFMNSIFGQKDCLVTTDGYNYIALDDDVWVYTGVTSVNSDESNVGFVLMNQRTMETKFYEVEGATEHSAMESAEGQVQNLKYEATFPLLLNISGEPTYFIALKDNAGLVKKYAMVNVQKYQIVGIGDTVAECESEYLRLMKKDGIQIEEEIETEIQSITGTISKIVQGVVDGNSHYYIMLKDSEEIFDISVVENIAIIKYDVGEEISFDYKKGTETNIVTIIK